MNNKRETVGIVYGFLQAALWGVFPVFVQRGVQDMPPLTFASLSTFLGGVLPLLWLVKTRRWNEYKNFRIYFPLCIVAICSTVLPYGMLFIGASMTSGVNTSVLLLTEIIFLMIFSHVIGEKTTVLKAIGALGVFVGAVIMMYHDGLDFRLGDALVVASTIPYFFGNFYGKKLLTIIAPQTIMVFRFFVGGLILFVTALIFERETTIIPLIQTHPWTLLINGLILLGVGKILWYQSLKHLDISKAVLIAMTFPLFSLGYLLILGEKITTQQWIGSAIMILGVFATVMRPSVDPMSTKYAHL